MCVFVSSNLVQIRFDILWFGLTSGPDGLFDPLYVRVGSGRV